MGRLGGPALHQNHSEIGPLSSHATHPPRGHPTKTGPDPPENLPRPGSKPSRRHLDEQAAEAEAEAEAELEAEPEAKSEAEPEANPEAEPEAEPDAEPAAKPEAELEAEPGAEPDAKSEADSKGKPEATPEAKSEAEPEAGPEAKSGAEPEAGSEAKPEAESEAGCEVMVQGLGSGHVERPRRASGGGCGPRGASGDGRPRIDGQPAMAERREARRVTNFDFVYCRLLLKATKFAMNG
jgi:membrane protein involved in colicin uptake